MITFKTSLSSIILFHALTSFKSITVTKAIDPSDYRLGNEILPENYQISLNIPSDFTRTRTFRGAVRITFTPTVEIATAIKLHISNLDLLEFKLFKTSSTPINLIRDTFQEDKQLEMAIFQIVDNVTLLASFTYVLEIEYVGAFNRDSRGFYVSPYKNSHENIEWVAATQFEPTYARSAFPCFDEPNFKATFEINITHPHEYHALSNARIKEISSINATMVTTIFDKTPKMSTYLMAFAISQYARMSMDFPEYHHAIWTRPEVLDAAKLPFDIAPDLITALEEMTSIPYVVGSAPTKLDQVAVPDYHENAMENWGLLMYSESSLLWNPSTSSASQKQRVATSVARQLAHAWFGNLVTFKWWDFAWLNEGFAKFFEYRALSYVETEWELDRHFVIKELQAAMVQDSSIDVQALTTLSVFTPAEIKRKMAEILSANKGASIIRMIESFMGDEQFFLGIADYLAVNQFKNTEPVDLWTSLAKFTHSPGDFEKTMRGWTEQAGFPLLTLTASGKNVKLHQKRFLYEESPNINFWKIPISYTHSKVKDFFDVAPKCWLSEEKSEIENVLEDETTWIIANIKESAYIRVNYDDILWDRIQQALQKEDYDGIHVLNRAQLVDDAMNLARAGLVPYERALDVVEYLANETEYYPWYSAMGAFSYLRSRIHWQDQLAKLLDAHILDLTGKLQESANEVAGEKQMDIHKKTLAHEWTCKLKQEECVQKSRKLFDDYMMKRIPIDPDLKKTVYCTAIRFSNNADTWRFLWKQYEITQSSLERDLIIQSLACTDFVALLTEFLQKTVDPTSGMRKRDALAAFIAVTENQEGVPIALEFLKTNFTLINQNYGSETALASVLLALGEKIVTKKQMAEFFEFLDGNIGQLGDEMHVWSVKKICERNMNWLDRFYQPLFAYLSARNPTVETTEGVSVTTPSSPDCALSLGVSTGILIFFVVVLFNL